MIDKNIFGKKLYDLRKKCGLSQNRIAQTLNVSYQAVSKWENGQALPDIEIIEPLAQIFGVTVDSLLCDEKAPKECSSNINSILNSYEINKDNGRIISILNNKLTKEDLYTVMNLIENKEMDININLSVQTKRNGKTEDNIKNIPADSLTDKTLSDFSDPIAQLVLKSLNKTDYTFKNIIHMLKCPYCGDDLILNEDENGNYIECSKGHIFKIIDGVVDFGTFEHHGNNWSHWFRTYDEFLNMKDKCRIPNEDQNKYRKIVKMEIDNIVKKQPYIILDIGSGMATYAEELIKHINWPCILILNDLSYRVLKYDKRYFDERIFNPNVKIAYLASDARNLTIKNNVCDCVTSFFGYENVLDDFMNSIKETYRVLKDNGLCVYEMSLVENIGDQNTKKWLELIEKDKDRDSHSNFEMIHDINEWYKINKNIGFKNCNITEFGEEMTAPDIDKFPYDGEVLRWTLNSVIASIK